MSIDHTTGGAPSLKTFQTVERLLGETARDVDGTRRDAAIGELRALGSEAVDAMRALLDFEEQRNVWHRAFIARSMAVILPCWAIGLAYPLFPIRTQDELLALLLTVCSAISAFEVILLLGEDLLTDKVVGFLLILGETVTFGKILVTLTTGIPQLAFALMPPTLALMSYYLVARGQTRMKPGIVDAAAQFAVSGHDKHIIPLLLELEDHVSSEWLAETRWALEHLLPALTQSDSDALSPQNRRLHDAIWSSRSSDPRFTIAALGALAHWR